MALNVDIYIFLLFYFPAVSYDPKKAASELRDKKNKQLQMVEAARKTSKGQHAKLRTYLCSPAISSNPELIPLESSWLEC